MLLLLFACTAAKDDSAAPLAGGDTCTALTSGTWYGAGAAVGMPDDSPDMTVTLVMDADTCLFTLSDWSMDMGPLPDQGALDGDAVQLAGPTSYYSSCTGTAASATAFTGTCSDDGDAFQFGYVGE